MRFSTNINENSNLLPDGEYPFEVIHADEKTSGNGNEMIVLKLRVGENGTSKVVVDYILSRQLRKIRMVAKACDLLDLFQAGEILAEHFIGRRGRVKLTVEKSASPDYADRNVVAGYVGGK